MFYDLQQRRWLVGAAARKVDMGLLEGAASVSPDLGGCRVLIIAAAFAAGADISFASPANAKPGDVAIFKLSNLGGVATTVWDAAYKFAGGEPAWTSAGTDQVAFVYDGAAWSESGLDIKGAA